VNTPQQRGGQAADVAWLLSDEALEIGRRAVEDELVELRDARIAQLRNNGLVVKERDGSPSDIIRLGPEDALRIGLRAMLTSAPPAPSVGGWRRIEEDAEVDVPLDTDLLLAWWDEWSEAWKIEANYAGSERGGWRHGRATHWMELPQPPKEKP